MTGPDTWGQEVYPMAVLDDQIRPGRMYPYEGAVTFPADDGLAFLLGLPPVSDASYIGLYGQAAFNRAISNSLVPLRTPPDWTRLPDWRAWSALMRDEPVC
jgi:hypothetical protein